MEPAWRVEKAVRARKAFSATKRGNSVSTRFMGVIRVIVIDCVVVVWILLI